MKNRILFVDDDPNVLDGLRRLLRARSDRWDMRFVGSVDEALDCLANEPFDAVISDVRMPGRDGFDLLGELRRCRRTANVPVVMLTGATEAGLKRQALGLGATDLLSKPVEREDLVARVQSVIRLKEAQDKLAAHNELLERRVEQRTTELAASRLDIIWRLGKAAEYRDEATGNHVIRVGCYSWILAKALGTETDFAETVFLASPLHDIGKIGVPDRILLKRGALTEDEWAIMKQHCAIGAQILEHDPLHSKAFRAWRRHAQPDAPRHACHNPVLRLAASIARTHHERWDGTGYPDGLRGSAIPLESRVVALCDTYDALRSERPYKGPCTESESLDIIGQGRGREFDPEIHSAFERCAGDFRTIREEFGDERSGLSVAACTL